MKITPILTSALFAGAIALSGGYVLPANAAANGNGGGTAASGNGSANNANGGAGATNLPSQRIVQGRANGQGAILTISPSGVREVQQRLNQLGYAAGNVNGVWNKRTGDAMLHFQQAHGLEPTGNLNYSSIAALGLHKRLLGNPIGNGNQSVAGNNSTGAPPPRGTVQSGSSMPPKR